MTNVVYYILLWISGALIGAICMAVYLYWSLSTGRRVVRRIQNDKGNQ